MARHLLALSLVLILAGPRASHGQVSTLPNGFYIEEVAPGSTFDLPVETAFAPDGRVFVAEKGGKIFVIENGVKLTPPFIDLTDEVMSQHDRGLLSIVFHPDFEENGYIYLLYTYDRDGTGEYYRLDNVARLTRYTVDANNPNVADLSTRKVLIGETYAEGIPTCFYSHAIGTVRFGLDGSLLLSSGDGASYTNVDAGGITAPCFVDGLDPVVNDIGSFRSISPKSLSGKILRVDPETGDGLPDNPFYTGDPTDNESKVWASGLRNPYRFAVGPADDALPNGPGTLYIADVGWLTWEELNVSKTGGENFGWPCYEGNHTAPEYWLAQPASYGCDTIADHVPPTFWFKHQDQNLSWPKGLRAQAILAGDIYAGTKYPVEYKNRLFYADYNRGWVASSAVNNQGDLEGQWVFGTDFGPVVTWRYNPFDEYFYFVNVWTGEVNRLRHSEENRPPVAVAGANVTAGLLPLEVDFTSAASYDPDGDPLRYVWEFGDGTKTKNPSPTHVYTTAGTWQARLTVTDPSGASHTRNISISAGNTFPEAMVHTPNGRTVVSIDDVLVLRGTAFDEQDATKYMTYAWKVISHHNTHLHPDVFTSNSRYAEYVIVPHGVPAEVTYLEARLIVTDSGGLSDTTTRYIEIAKDGEQDVTPYATPIALVLHPSTPVSANLGVIADGILLEPGSADPSMQYDTIAENPKSVDWIGYELDAPRYLSRLEFQEGVHADNGGWFDDFRVEVRTGGDWTEVQYLSSIEPYQGSDGEDLGLYSIHFGAIFGDGIRIIGTPGGSAAYVSIGELRVFAIPGPPQNNFETVSVGDVSANEWTTVGLQHEYGSMVSVCAVAQSEQTTPLAVRMRRASGSSFEIRLQAPDSTSSVLPETVHCVVTSEGDWRLPDGTRLIARKYDSTVTDGVGSWVGAEQLAPAGLTNPVVVGQVMTANDERWSSFWARGEDQNSAPSAGHLFTGKYIIGDSSLTLIDEAIGYIAFEGVHGTHPTLEFEAGRSSTVRSIAWGPTAVPFNTAFAEAPRVAVTSPAGMPLQAPAWPVLFGADALAADSFAVAIQGEAFASDSTALASAAYAVFSSAGGSWQLEDANPPMTSAAVAAKVEEAVATVNEFEIQSVYPNPFHDAVKVVYTLPEAALVSAEVFDLLGRRVQRIVNADLARGTHQVEWSGLTASGTPAAPGVYFLIIGTPDARLEQKVVKVR